MGSYRFLLGLLLAAALLLAGCSQQLSDEELKQRLVSANSNLDSYSIDMKMTMDMVAEVSGEKMNMNYDIVSKGEIDRANRRMALQSSVKYDLSGMKMELDMDIYAVDDFIYTKAMNMWMKMRLDEDLWSQQDQVEQMVELISSGTIERLADESEGGSSYYVVLIKPDLKKAVELALKQQEQAEMFNELMNLEDMVKSYSSKVWINKDSFIVEKSRTEMQLVMTPENMGRQGDDVSGEISLNLVVDVRMYNINKQVTISLPEDAKDAMDLSSLREDIGQNSEQPQNIGSITGNAIAEVFG